MGISSPFPVTQFEPDATPCIGISEGTFLPIGLTSSAIAEQGLGTKVIL